MARALHTDACRNHVLVAWVAIRDHPAYPDWFIAQLVTPGPLPHVLMADTLATQEQLPPGLVWSERQPVHPPEVEVWLIQ